MAQWWEYLGSNVLNPDHTLGIVFYALVTLLVVMMVAGMTKWLFGRISESWRRRLRIDETTYHFVKGLLVFGIYFTGLIVYVSLIPRLHALMSAILASAGIAAIVLGLAAQNTLSNIVAGLLITMFRPVRIGDVVSIGEDYGQIEDVSLMYTVVRTWDQRRLVIPNSVLSNSMVVNFSHTDPRMLVHVEMGISYDADIDKARAIMIDEAMKSEQRLKNAEEPFVRVVEVGDFAVVMRLYVWVAHPDQFYVTKFQLMETIKKRFDAEGVEIPFPYRTIVYKKDLETEAAAEPA